MTAFIRAQLTRARAHTFWKWIWDDDCAKWVRLRGWGVFVGWSHCLQMLENEHGMRSARIATHTLTHSHSTVTKQNKAKQSKTNAKIWKFNTVSALKTLFSPASVCLYHFLACNTVHTRIHLHTFETYMLATEHGINWPLMPPASCLLFRCCYWRWWWWDGGGGCLTPDVFPLVLKFNDDYDESEEMNESSKQHSNHNSAKLWHITHSIG